MDEIVLFSTGCSKCIVLEKKLDKARINYTKANDLLEIINMGYLSVPILQVGGKYLDFAEAVNWVNSQGK